MASERESNHLNYRRREWLKSALCPSCGEENTATKSMLIEMNESGQAHCNACDHDWRPTL
jgi:transcription elongation factor Elf1